MRSIGRWVDRSREGPRGGGGVACQSSINQHAQTPTLQFFHPPYTCTHTHGHTRTYLGRPQAAGGRSQAQQRQTRPEQHDAFLCLFKIVLIDWAGQSDLSHESEQAGRRQACIAAAAARLGGGVVRSKCSCSRARQQARRPIPSQLPTPIHPTLPSTDRSIDPTPPRHPPARPPQRSMHDPCRSPFDRAQAKLARAVNGRPLPPRTGPTPGKATPANLCVVCMRHVPPHASLHHAQICRSIEKPQRESVDCSVELKSIRSGRHRSIDRTSSPAWHKVAKTRRPPRRRRAEAY